MYCTNCGNELPPNAKACGSCGQRTPYFPPPPNVPNYLVHSIVTTLCCCLPFGVVALVYSAQVNSKLIAGDVAGAQASSRNAKTWSIVALIAGIVSGAGLAALSLWQ
jgi:hypothetical protein